MEESPFSGCTASPTCTDLVQTVDPHYFCESDWDAMCVAWANYFCQSDSLNDPNQCCECLDVSDGTGCSANAACQVQVCANDNHCCTQQWDDFCVNRASHYCADLGGMSLYIYIYVHFSCYKLTFV